MDQKNYFESRTTFYLHRAEYFVGLCVSLYLLFLHWREIDWWHFVILFAYIDLIGYIPGAIAYRLSKDQQISRVYYVLYNAMHSLVTAAAVAGAWILLIGAEWALLALPIHLFADRALFGNFLKSFSVSFEPREHPAYGVFKRDMGYR